MKSIITIAIVAALLCPTMLLASHHKKNSSSSAQPASHQPNLHGRVTHGAHSVHATVTVTARGHHRGAHPRVTSSGQFSMHLKPGVYTAWAKRRGAGKGHVSFSINQGQTMNIVVPLIHHHRMHAHQVHHLGVAHRPVATPAKAPTTPKNVTIVPTPSEKVSGGRVLSH
jgi:hypothetical protein